MMRAIVRAAIVALVAIAPGACGGAQLGPGARPGEQQEGLAVYYADSLQGKPTASGTPYDKAQLTAAHRTLPFGARVRVTNLENRRSVEVVINDRGPFDDRRRIIDLSRAAAERIDMLRRGVVRVRVEIVSLPDDGQPQDTD